MYTNHSFTLLKFLIVQNFKFLNGSILNFFQECQVPIIEILFLFCSLQWRIQGRGPGKPVPPLPPYPHFKTKLRPEGPKKNFVTEPGFWFLAGFWFPLEMTFEEELQKFYSDKVTTQIKVVLLTGRAAMDLCFPDLRSDTSSVWTFCSCS